jgi:hypothetical protein
MVNLGQDSMGLRFLELVQSSVRRFFQLPLFSNFQKDMCMYSIVLDEHASKKDDTRDFGSKTRHGIASDPLDVPGSRPL